MKLTLANVKQIRTDTSTLLIKRACSYVIDRWHDYSDKKHIFTDVLKYGCQSGTVGFLIYYHDTVRFYEKYKTDINELLYELFGSCGTNDPKKVFGERWDEEDPLAQDVYNKNLLAWFGFEEALRIVGNKFEEVQYYI